MNKIKLGYQHQCFIPLFQYEKRTVPVSYINTRYFCKYRKTYSACTIEQCYTMWISIFETVQSKICTFPLSSVFRSSRQSDSKLSFGQALYTMAQFRWLKRRIQLWNTYILSSDCKRVRLLGIIGKYIDASFFFIQTPADFQLKIINSCRKDNEDLLYVLQVSAQYTGVSQVQGMESRPVTYNLGKIYPIYVLQINLFTCYKSSRDFIFRLLILPSLQNCDCYCNYAVYWTSYIYNSY